MVDSIETYNKFAKTWSDNPDELDLEDQVKLATTIPQHIKKHINRVVNKENYSEEESKYSDDYLKKNKDAFIAYDQNKVFEYLKEQNAEKREGEDEETFLARTEDIKNFNKYAAQGRGIEKTEKNILPVGRGFKPEKLPEKALRAVLPDSWEKAFGYEPEPESDPKTDKNLDSVFPKFNSMNDLFMQERMSLDNEEKIRENKRLQNIPDLPKFAMKGAIGKGIYEPLAFITSDAGNFIADLTYRPLTEAIFGEETMAGLREGPVGQLDRYIGNLVSFRAAADRAADIEYGGWLKDNPETAEIAEDVLGFAAAVPLEALAATKYIHGAYTTAVGGNRFISKAVYDNLDKAADDAIKSTILPGLRKKLVDAKRNRVSEMEARGIENYITRVHRDIYATTAFFAGGHALTQNMEMANPELADNGFYQFGKTVGLFGAAMFAPSIVDTAAKQLDLISSVGPPTFMRSIKYGLQTGFQSPNLDDMLIKQFGYSPDMLINMTEQQKLKHVKLTAKEFRRMKHDFDTLESLRRDDIKNNTNRFEEFTNRAQELNNTRNEFRAMLAEMNGMKVDDYFAANPAQAESIDIGLEAMLDSDGLKSIVEQGKQAHKIPALQRFNLKTIYNDVQRNAEKEIERRQLFANVLNKLLPATEVNTKRGILLNTYRDINNKNIEEAKNNVAFGARKAGEEMASLRKASLAGEELPEITTKQLSEMLTPENKEILNQRRTVYALTDWKPAAERRKDLSRPGRPRDNTYLQDYGEESRTLFDNTLLAAKKKIDDKYAAVREDNVGLRIRTDDPELNNEFNKIKQRLESPDVASRSYGVNPYDYNNFRTYYMRVGNNWITKLASIAEEGKAEIGLDSILKPYVARINGLDPDLLENADEIARKLDEYKAGISFKVDGEDMTLAEAPPYVYSTHLKSLLENTMEEGEHLLDIAFDVNSLQEVRSSLLAAGREARYGSKAMKMYNEIGADLGVVIEAASAKQLRNNPNFQSFIDANREYATNWVPLFKHGEMATIGSKTSTGERLLPDDQIFQSFLMKGDKADPVGAVNRFSRVFGDNPNAVNLLRKAIGKNLDEGKGFLDEQVQGELYNRRLIDKKLYDTMDSNTLAYKDETVVLQYDEAMARLKNAGDTTVDEKTRGLLQSISNIDGSLPDDVVTKIRKHTPDEFSEMLTNVGKTYEGGVKALKSDMETMFGSVMVAKVTALGDDLAKESMMLVKEADKSILGKPTIAGRTIKKKVTGLVGLGEGSYANFRAKALKADPNKSEKIIEVEWGAELDSRAFQEVLADMSPYLEILDPKKLKDLKTLSKMSTMFGRAAREVRTATGAARDMTVESLISRIYSVQRGVISARYVMTEAGVQAFRRNRLKMLNKMLTDERVPDLVLEVVFGKGLQDAKVKARWIRFMRGWTGLSVLEASDESIVNETELNFADFLAGPARVIRKANIKNEQE